VSYSIQIPQTIRLKFKACRALSSPRSPSARVVYVRTRPQRGLAGVFSISGSHLVRLVPHLRVVRIAQTAFSDWRSLQARGLSGSYATEANVDQFVRSRNVERYRRLLERVTEESDRQQIINLLAEERQKQKDAGDCRNVC
jgi:hypothetical protein